jgi:hypothetical protein
VLRDERSGPDRRVLAARIDENGDLLIEGHDLVPGTSPVSGDGEYEWRHTIAAADIPRLLELLTEGGEADVLDVLQARFTGDSSYELEEILRESGLPTRFSSWP